MTGERVPEGPAEEPDILKAPEMAKMWGRVVEACADAPLHVGFVHDVLPHTEYEMPGIAVPVSWLEEDGQVRAKVLWIPIPLVPLLLRTAEKLRSPAFIAAMEEIGR